MMDCSYQSVYESYASFCTRIGQAPLDFETWMHKRDEPERSPAQKTKDFLEQAEQDQVHA
jgi:hypothetical protein